MSILGTLDDEVSIARFTGSSRNEIRQWLIQQIEMTQLLHVMRLGPNKHATREPIRAEFRL